VQPLVHNLLTHARQRGQCAAFVTSAGTITYAALSGMVAAAASALGRAGVTHGQRVVLCAPNGPSWAAAYFAIHAVGAIAVPLDADAAETTRRQVVEQSGATFAFADARIALPIPAEPLDLAVTDAATSWEIGRPALDDPADLLFTTGTSGQPKGVLLTHRQIAQAATNINAIVRSAADDLELVPLPLSHSFGLGRLRAMAQTGNAMLLTPGMRNPAKVLLLLLEHKATGLALVPAGFDLLLRMTRDRLADARDHLRYIEIGSAAMRRDTQQRLMALLPHTRICHHYGLTEASRAAFLDYQADGNKLDSAGRPSPNVEIAIRDNAGHALPAGESGEVVVRGGMVMREYWQRPALTAETLVDGWLRTGDRGYFDADGYLYLLGRQSNVVNVGGRKVSAEEVEQHLSAHPAVIEAACLAAADPQNIVGQCLKAYLVTRDDVSDDDLVAWLRGRVEEFKIPRLWQRVPALPRTASGKIQHHRLAELEKRA
jgi:long-chain acyl-CoA synthetase